MNLIKTDFTKQQEYLQSTFIFYDSFDIMIKEFDSTSTIFYLDPPYDKCKDYDNYISPAQIYDALKNIKGWFLLSYNDSPNIRSIFKDYNLHELKTKQSPTKYLQYRSIQELEITNYIV